MYDYDLIRHWVNIKFIRTFSESISGVFSASNRIGFPIKVFIFTGKNP